MTVIDGWTRISVRCVDRVALTRGREDLVMEHRDLRMVPEVDVTTLDQDELCAYLTRLEAQAAIVAAMQHRATAELVRRRPNDCAEILAIAVDETTRVAGTRCETSARLVECHGNTVARLANGLVTPRQATALQQACRALPAAVAHQVDREIWTRVDQDSADPSAVAAAAHVIAQRIDAESAQRRAAQERSERRIETSADRDGMGWLAARLCLEDLSACRDVLDDATRTVDPTDPRSRDQRRADWLVERITGQAPLIATGLPHLDTTASTAGTQEPAKPRRRIDLNVVIGLDVLLGLQAGSASLDGKAVPADLARALLHADTTVLRRLIADPFTGLLLDRSPRTYRPGAALAAFVTTRDQQCLWPGCHARARRCQLDHHDPFPQGATVRTNLGPFCEHHHQLKHTAGWDFTRHPDGSATLTGPGTTTHIPAPRLVDPRPPEPPPPAQDNTPPPDDPPPF